MQTHTPGEWIALNKPGTGIYKIVTDGIHEICETQMPYGNDFSRPEVFEQAEANANLISAAPDLLAACLECLELIERTPNACGLNEKDINAMPHVKRLRAAIRKSKIAVVNC